MKFIAGLVLAVACAAQAQFEILDGKTTASLRGIDAVSPQVAWASGSSGTVLLTTDGGANWKHCAVPPGGEKLDFRGVQGFDATTAIVMSSGKGDLSRLYKTTDACQTWIVLFTNPDSDGFWDAMHFTYGEPQRPYRVGELVGDPVNGKFVHYFTYNFGESWTPTSSETAASARGGESLFAASNSAFLLDSGGGIFVTGGISGSRSRVLSEYVKHDPFVSWRFVGGDIPLSIGESAGAFSIASSHTDDRPSITAPNRTRRAQYTVYFADMNATYVAVGGDYKKPDGASGTASFSKDGGQHWERPTTLPHGYRSAVAYNLSAKTWITIGPNGTDISKDDGKNWTPLKAAANDAPDADKNWNAISLPFVVGPNGKIGKLKPGILRE